MIVISKFFVFLLLAHLSGRGLFILLKKINCIKQDLSEIKIFKIPLNYFYILSYLIFLGNITFVVNFLIELPQNFGLILNFVLVLMNLLYLKKIKVDLFITISTFVTIIFLSLSSYSVGLSYDAGLYHLNYQLWIKSEKIVLGLANFHMRYGYSSIFDYISANYNNFENYLYLHFLNLSFLFIFFTIIFYIINYSNSIFYKASGLGLLIFGILDNFGLGGGKNGFIEIEGITKYDSVFGSLFVLSNMFLINILKQKELKNFEINYFLVLCIFLAQLRPTGFVFLIFSLIMLIKKSRVKFFNLFNNKVRYFLLVLLILWFIKNILISGCLIFPIETTCVKNIKWYSSGYAKLEALNIGNSLRSYQLFSNPIDWVYHWISKNNYNLFTIINLGVSLLIIYTFKRIFFICKKVDQLQIIFSLYCLLLLLYWILTAPDLRFGIGIFLTIILSFFINIVSLKIETNKLIIFILFTLCLFATPRFENYSTFLENSFKNIYIYAPENPEYVLKMNSYGVTTKNNSEQCWINIECTPVYTPIVEKEYIGSYLVFIQNDD